MPEVYIIDGARTPVGTLQGSLSDVSAIELGVIAAQGAIQRSAVDPQLIDFVVLGNVIQSSKDAIYLPRHVALKAEVRVEPRSGRRLCPPQPASCAPGTTSGMVGRRDRAGHDQGPQGQPGRVSAG